MTKKKTPQTIIYCKTLQGGKRSGEEKRRKWHG